MGQKDLANIRGTNSRVTQAVKKVLTEEVNLSFSDIKDGDLT